MRFCAATGSPRRVGLPTRRRRSSPRSTRWRRARASPSLANELWDTAATLLATWARWRSADHPAIASDVRATLARVLAVVRDRALDAHRQRAKQITPRNPALMSSPLESRARTPPNSHPSSDQPPRSSSRASPPPLRATTNSASRLSTPLVRLADAGARSSASSSRPPRRSPRTLVRGRSATRKPSRRLSCTPSPPRRRSTHTRVSTVSGACARRVRAPRDDVSRDVALGRVFARRVGATLIAGCKTLHPRRYYPRAASVAAAAARDALASSADGASADVRESAFGRGRDGGGEGGADPVAVDAMRTAVGMTIRITADESLAGIARVWSGVVGESDGSRDARRGDGAKASRRARFVFPLILDIRGRRARFARWRRSPSPRARASSNARTRLTRRSSTRRFARRARVSAFLRRLLASLDRVEPSAAAARVRLATLAPSAMFTPSLMTLIATRVDASPTLRDRAASTTFAYASRFARRFHESYRGFVAGTRGRRSPRWIQTRFDPRFSACFARRSRSRASRP